MLTTVAEGVRVHESACLQSNTIIVDGAAGALVVDAGLTRTELTTLADDLREAGHPVTAGFSTHAHWDHVLWDAALGDVPRYATAASAASLCDLLATDGWQADIEEGLPPQIMGEVPMELLGQVTGLPVGATELPWDGPELRILEHRAHVRGHAALFVAGSGGLIAGDMLSDVLVPMLDLHGSDDPIGDYLTSLDLLESIAGDVSVVIPGHGSVGDAAELRKRIDDDRAYVLALRDNTAVTDHRLGSAARPGWEWVGGIHEWQARSLAT